MSPFSCANPLKYSFFIFTGSHRSRPRCHSFRWSAALRLRGRRQLWRLSVLPQLWHQWWWPGVWLPPQLWTSVQEVGWHVWRRARLRLRRGATRSSFRTTVTCFAIGVVVLMTTSTTPQIRAFNIYQISNEKWILFCPTHLQLLLSCVFQVRQWTTTKKSRLKLLICLISSVRKLFFYFILGLLLKKNKEIPVRIFVIE